MARTKEPTENMQDVVAISENTVMHSWDSMHDADYKLAQERSPSQYNPYEREQEVLHEGTFYMRPEWKIEGMQLAWIMERLMNEVKEESLEKAFHKGWRPVRRDECYWLMNEEYPDFIPNYSADGYVRKSGMMLMKMPIETYQRQQESYRKQGEEVRRQSNELTAYLSDHQGPVKTKVYENSSSYQPSYRHK